MERGGAVTSIAGTGGGVLGPWGGRTFLIAGLKVCEEHMNVVAIAPRRESFEVTVLLATFSNGIIFVLAPTIRRYILTRDESTSEEHQWRLLMSSLHVSVSLNRRYEGDQKFDATVVELLKSQSARDARARATIVDAPAACPPPHRTVCSALLHAGGRLHGS